MRIFHGPLASFRQEDQKWKMNFVAENIIWAFSCANFFIIMAPKTISKRRVRILSIIGEFKHFWADDD